MHGQDAFPGALDAEEFASACFSQCRACDRQRPHRDSGRVVVDSGKADRVIAHPNKAQAERSALRPVDRELSDESALGRSLHDLARVRGVGIDEVAVAREEVAVGAPLADTLTASIGLAAERWGAGRSAVTSADWRGAHSIAKRLLRRAPLCLIVRQEPVELLGMLRIDTHLAATGIAQRSWSDCGAGPGRLRVADLRAGNCRAVSGAQC